MRFPEADYFPCSTVLSTYRAGHSWRERTYLYASINNARRESWITARFREKRACVYFRKQHRSRVCHDERSIWREMILNSLIRVLHSCSMLRRLDAEVTKSMLRFTPYHIIANKISFILDAIRCVKPNQTNERDVM